MVKLPVMAVDVGTSITSVRRGWEGINSSSSVIPTRHRQHSTSTAISDTAIHGLVLTSALPWIGLLAEVGDEPPRLEAQARQ